MSTKEMTPKITLGQTVYNPETAAFESKAQVFEGRARFSYRVSLKVAPHAEFASVTRGLKAQALSRHGEARKRTQRFLRGTVHSVLARTKTKTRDAFALGRIGAFLSA